jgi:hypothetical protein
LQHASQPHYNTLLQGACLLQRAMRYSCHAVIAVADADSAAADIDHCITAAALRVLRNLTRLVEHITHAAKNTSAAAHPSSQADALPMLSLTAAVSQCLQSLHAAQPLISQTASQPARLLLLVLVLLLPQLPHCSPLQAPPGALVPLVMPQRRCCES